MSDECRGHIFTCILCFKRKNLSVVLLSRLWEKKNIYTWVFRLCHLMHLQWSHRQPSPLTPDDKLHFYIFQSQHLQHKHIKRILGFYSHLLLYLYESCVTNYWDLAEWIRNVDSSSSSEQVCYEMVEHVHEYLSVNFFPKMFQESLSWLHFLGNCWGFFFLSHSKT